MGVYLYPNNTETELKNAYIGSTPVKRATMRVNTSRLPAEYQEVEWILGEGTAQGNRGTYIDTGFKPNNNTRLVVDYEKTNVSSAPGGCYNNPSSVGFIINDQGLQYNNSYENVSGLNINTRLLADLNKNEFYLNGTLLHTFTAGTFQMNINAWLFGWNKNGLGSNNYSGIKMYSAKIYDDGTLIRDFVPCYRKSDTEVGMYDIVNGVFYANPTPNDGTFTKGPDVPSMVEKQIRPAAEHLPALSEWNWTADQSATFGSWGQLSFSPDGTTISNGGINNNRLYRGTCTVPYDLSTITNTSDIQINMGGAWSGIGKCARSTDGYYFITSSNQTLYKYSVTTPFTFSGATQVQTVTVSVDIARGFHVLWGGQYICNSRDGLRWRMSTPYDLTTLQPTSAVNTTFITSEKADIFATQTGNEAYITVYGDSTIKRLTFQTPFDFSTVVVEESHPLGYHPQGVWYAKDGQNEYLFIGEGYGKIRRYIKA